MIFDFHNEAESIDREAFTGKMPVGAAKRLGMAVMRGGVGVANTALFAAAALREDKDPLFRLHDEVIEPARRYWTPDEPSTSKAMQYLEAFAELPLQLVGGPSTLVASTVMNGAEELVDAGVDPLTAVGLGTVQGAVTAGTMALPAAGKTIRQTLMLAAANPLIGGAAAQVSNSVLSHKGYHEQAKAYDPFDWTARGVDLTLGLAFGGLAHYAKVKGRLPVEVVDAIDTVETNRKARNASPFDENADPALAGVHMEAYNKAVEDVVAGNPVDVSQVIGRRGMDGPSGFKDADVDFPPREKDMPSHVEGEGAISDSGASAQSGRTYDSPLLRAEMNPGEIQARKAAAKEIAPLVEELAAKYPEGTGARVRPPHQEVAPWAMSRGDLFVARDNLRGWYEKLEESVLGKQVKEWRRAVRRGDTEVTDRIEGGLTPEEVAALYGVDTKYAPDDFARLADARDVVRAGFELGEGTEKALAAEIASSLYKMGDKRDPRRMEPSELDAYVKIDEAFEIVRERGWDSRTVSDEALKIAAEHFSDPEDARYMLGRFLEKGSPAEHYGARQPVGSLGERPGLIDTVPVKEHRGVGSERMESESSHQVNVQDGQRSVAEAPTTTTARELSVLDHEPLAYDVEALLRERGDMPLVRYDADGQRVNVSARQVIDEAISAVERTRKLEMAYKRAALCLGLG